MRLIRISHFCVAVIAQHGNERLNVLMSEICSGPRDIDVDDRRIGDSARGSLRHGEVAQKALLVVDDGGAGGEGILLRSNGGHPPGDGRGNPSGGHIATNLWPPGIRKKVPS